jgi:hypothetical protein
MQVPPENRNAGLAPGVGSGSANLTSSQQSDSELPAATQDAGKPKLDYPTESEILWLFEQGVSDTAMLSPTLIRAAKVLFLDNNTFDFDGEGIRAVVFEEGDDLIAWNPKRNLLATWGGVAFALREEAIWNPASCFMGSALRVHRTPLEWLVANRDGIVILQPRFTYAYLRDFRLSFSDRLHAQRVTRWLQPPKPTAEILIEIEERRSA